MIKKLKNLKFSFFQLLTYLAIEAMAAIVLTVIIVGVN